MHNNVLQEVLQCLKDNNKNVSDIRWIGIDNTWFDWVEFKTIADIDVSDSVNDSLIIVGDDWWLESCESYDDCWGTGIWFEFKKFPLKPEERWTNPNSRNLLR